MDQVTVASRVKQAVIEASLVSHFAVFQLRRGQPTTATPSSTRSTPASCWKRRPVSRRRAGRTIGLGATTALSAEAALCGRAARLVPGGRRRSQRLNSPDFTPSRLSATSTQSPLAPERMLLRNTAPTRPLHRSPTLWDAHDKAHLSGFRHTPWAAPRAPSVRRELQDGERPRDGCPVRTCGERKHPHRDVGQLRGLQQVPQLLLHRAGKRRCRESKPCRSCLNLIRF